VRLRVFSAAAAESIIITAAGYRKDMAGTAQTPLEPMPGEFF